MYICIYMYIYVYICIYISLHLCFCRVLDFEGETLVFRRVIIEVGMILSMGAINLVPSFQPLPFLTSWPTLRVFAVAAAVPVFSIMWTMYSDLFLNSLFIP